MLSAKRCEARGDGDDRRSAPEVATRPNVSIRREIVAFIESRGALLQQERRLHAAIAVSFWSKNVSQNHRSTGAQEQSCLDDGSWAPFSGPQSSLFEFSHTTRPAPPEFPFENAPAHPQGV